METTWDGLPVAREPPYACCVVVWRDGPAGREFLLLHRAHEGPDYAGDWAWTPPSGARQPGEEPEAGAARELREEARLELSLAPVESPHRDVVFSSRKLRPTRGSRSTPNMTRFAGFPSRQPSSSACRPASRTVCGQPPRP